MSLCDERGFWRLIRKWPEGAAVAALRDIDAVDHKKVPGSVQTNSSALP